jgi:hypothetical protein
MCHTYLSSRIWSLQHNSASQFPRDATTNSENPCRLFQYSAGNATKRRKRRKRKAVAIQVDGGAPCSIMAVGKP